MIVRYLVAGDQGITDDIEFEGVADLTGTTNIVGHVWKSVGPPDPHDLEVELIDADTRIIRVHYGDEPTDWLPTVTGQSAWRFEIEATWPDQPAVTSPRRTAVTLKVRAQAPPIPDEED